MSDTTSETETLSPPAQYLVGHDSQGEFSKVISQFGHDLKENGALTLDQLIDHALEIESRYMDRLSDDELAVLATLSLLLGTSQREIKTRTSREPTSSEQRYKVWQETIGVEQEVAGLILSNVGEDGKPKSEVSKYYRLVASIYEDYFNPESPKLTDAGLERESKFFQGILGSVTTAFLFKSKGYEVRFPPALYDLKWNVDLLVKSPEGELFAVDITAKDPLFREGGQKAAFSVETKDPPDGFPRHDLTITKGFLRVNVPPLTHHASLGFYEDRSTGYPSESAKSEFSSKIDEILRQQYD